MLFFKRILGDRKAPPPTTERRVAARHPVSREFPLQSVLNIAGRDEQGEPLKSGEGEGWDWPGRLMDVSAAGARLQVPLTVMVQRDDRGRLKLEVQGYKLEVPCRVTHVAERRAAFDLGLELDLRASATRAAYGQLFDLVALGASLRLVKAVHADRSGYLLEEYAGEPSSRLSIWRHRAGRGVAAFEFLLKDCFVRGVDGGEGLEFFAGSSAAAGRGVTAEQGAEIYRLFQWVVLNLATAVPADARAFLLKQAI